ncbi:GCN5-related N-acetyltransferase [Erythrobacter arachoides]|uniref:GCN5-related N-acetyltransferase n=1 Tax=Aurantiacibacter arachoides TaxID=1850444 RepID=A0A844ZY06_9SPHN|nr:GCN5-related N-acetyltransferase [Aurantiacibacter arachoides]MXO92765.1 GCN5-related N-acetyltransferase [Aurantiacibacter arachoides]GGD54661.1 hypothetical protein GCM10011411_13250 [Aurantiacibacter arachoides]
MTRETVTARWFALTRVDLPAVAGERDWPVRLDHCFQRILLDNAIGRPWREAIAAPAYRNAPDEVLQAAIALGEAVLAGSADLPALNRRSLALRGKLRA